MPVLARDFVTRPVQALLFTKVVPEESVDASSSRCKPKSEGNNSFAGCYEGQILSTSDNGLPIDEDEIQQSRKMTQTTKEDIQRHFMDGYSEIIEWVPHSLSAWTSSLRRVWVLKLSCLHIDIISILIKNRVARLQRQDASSISYHIFPLIHITQFVLTPSLSLVESDLTQP